MVAWVEFEADWDSTLRPSTEAVKLPPARAVGIVMAADPAVPVDSATVKVTVFVPWSNVSPETDEVELTKMG